MADPIFAPRINNNDDFVKVTQIRVTAGQKVAPGDELFEIQTDKAVVAVEAERGGFVLGFSCKVGDKIAVGSVMGWLGVSADEPIPQSEASVETPKKSSSQPTLKALKLIKKEGLDVSKIPSSGERLSVQDVLNYLEKERATVAGQPLSPEERAMVETVSWHGREAVPGYIETAFDPSAWQSHTKDFARNHSLMVDPLLPLMAFQLAQYAKQNPRVNATIAGDSKIQFPEVNLGFTVEAKGTLYLVVLRDATRFSPLDFVNELGDLIKRAFAKKLKTEETTGATIAFTSMAKWGVARHIPVLPPRSAIIVAHSEPKVIGSKENSQGPHLFGATYDHRVLDGNQVARLLNSLCIPAIH